jgi:hypothetical protein
MVMEGDPRSFEAPGDRVNSIPGCGWALNYYRVAIPWVLTLLFERILASDQCGSVQRESRRGIGA